MHVRLRSIRFIACVCASYASAYASLASMCASCTRRLHLDFCDCVCVYTCVCVGLAVVLYLCVWCIHQWSVLVVPSS